MNCRLCDPVGAANNVSLQFVLLEPEYAVGEDVAAMHAAGNVVLIALLSIDHGGEPLAMGIEVFEKLMSK